MEEINKLRKGIDDIDKEMAELIEKRALIAKDIGDFKTKSGIGVVQPDREKKVLDHVKKSLKAIPPESAEAIWKEIMSACKVVQGRINSVYFLGPAGTFTELAAKSFFPKAGTKFLPATNKLDVFSKVEGDYADFGIVPIENSLEGSVRESLDLLIEKNLNIFGEIEIRVVHNLIGDEAGDLSKIKTVFSHPQALSQCNTWLLRNIPNAELVETSSTAKAVKKVSKSKNSEYAAIGTSLAASIYNLDIIASGIEDNTQNYTRFLIISKKENMPTDHDKTSMVFVTKHIPGALYRVIKLFADAGINLLKIESRPRKKDLWEYIFIIEFEGHQNSVKETLEQLKEFTIFMKILGSYPMRSTK